MCHLVIYDIISAVNYMISILYEDEYIIICCKKPGMLSEFSQSDDSLPKMLQEQIKSDIYPLHRLDKPVGGAIMYAKTQKAAGIFSKMIAENNLEKTYLAVLDGIPDYQQGELRDLLFKDSRKNKTFVVKRMRKGVKEAVLNFEVIASENNLSLVKIKLETGRSHQIRVQFASRKTPVCGDGKYGSRNNRCTTALWSHSLSFIHPFTKEKLSISAEPDFNSFPWNEFKI